MGLQIHRKFNFFFLKIIYSILLYLPNPNLAASYVLERAAEAKTKEHAKDVLELSRLQEINKQHEVGCYHLIRVRIRLSFEYSDFGFLMILSLWSKPKSRSAHQAATRSIPKWIGEKTQRKAIRVLAGKGKVKSEIVEILLKYTLNMEYGTNRSISIFKIFFIHFFVLLQTLLITSN